MNVADHFVCKGLVSDFNETFKYVVKEVLKDPSEACGIVIKGCNGSFPIDTATWFLPIPAGKPPHTDPILPEKGKPILKVLHLSDLHIDNEYIIGAEAKCGEMMCCRPAGDDNAGFKAKATIDVPAGKWGTYGNCDSPYRLVEDLMKHISVTHKDLDYVVVSGDLESHADWGYTREGHQEKVRNVTRLMKKYLPGINIYFAQGNHESVPLDAFAPSWTPQEYHMDWMYGTEADEWSDWLPEDSLTT
uniref:Calcineurin-like phosphoesterase domain-containing protein n=1 Tax=Panagrolaimus superbus TaxID=310955 RepID=A0A914YU45_9BILA